MGLVIDRDFSAASTSLPIFSSKADGFSDSSHASFT
jgi:hypothetical protein